MHIEKTGSVAHLPAGRGVLAPIVNGRDRMVCRQRDDVFAAVKEDDIGTDQERTGPALSQSRERGVDFALGASVQDMQLQPESARYRLRISCLFLRNNRAGRVCSSP